MEYTTEYFINKFESIPEHLWTTGAISDQKGDAGCALVHCGVDKYYIRNEEAAALAILFLPFLNRMHMHGGWYPHAVYAINDAAAGLYRKGTIKIVTADTPKERVLQLLYHIKGQEANKPHE